MSARDREVERRYAPALVEARARIHADPVLAAVLEPAPDPALMLGFLLEFSARAVAMTEPVEGWIAAAGRRCQDRGHAELGRTLVRHAAHEADHHRLLLRDLDELVARWNRERRPALSCAALLARPPLASTRAYLELHEATIAGPAPYGQLAIEYEIEAMSTVLGPALIAAARRSLGPEIDASLSFIREHALLDVGHTAVNEAALERLLRQRPELAPELAALGSNALHIYLDFLADCVSAAQDLVCAARPRA